MSTTGVPSAGAEVGATTDEDCSRPEDREILTGEREYTGDISARDQLYAAIYRSPHAHARIKELDITGALEIDGIVGGMTGDSLPEYARPLTSYPPDIPALEASDRTGEPNPKTRSHDHHCLARGRVRFVGEPVAVVVAENRYVAEDALERIHASYEKLPPVVDEVEAFEDDSPLLYEEWGDNRLLEFEIENGDVEECFRRSDHVFEEEIRHHRFTSTPMEPRAILADYDVEGTHLTVYNPKQGPHKTARHLEACLAIPSLTVDLVAENIGGSFGQKGGFYPEDMLVPLLAVHYDRPVKWVELRTEHMVSTTHGREQTHRLTVGVSDDGEIEGIEDTMFFNSGAGYPSAAIPSHITTAQFIPGVYTVQNYHCRAYGMVTNKTPFGAFRGLGKAGASYVIERLVSIISDRLDIDPATVRFRNFIQPEEFPYRSATGANYDSGDYPAALERAMGLAKYDQWREEQRARRERDDDTLVGIGISVSVEPSSATRKNSYHAVGYYAVRMQMDASGTIHVFPEDPDVGTSHESSILKIVSETVDVDPGRIDIVQGDTRRCPEGSGTYSSRFSVVGTAACYEAAERLATEIRQIAGAALDEPPDSLAIETGEVVSEASGASLSFGDIGHIAYKRPAALPEGRDPGIDFTHYYFDTNVDFDLEGTGRASTFSTYPYTADVAVVEVETGPGFLEVAEYASVHDCGNILDRKIVEGQHLGALAHGFGGAMFEELPYDDDGQPLHRSFMDYLAPTAGEIPEVTMEHIETPSPFNPGGHKGTGETGTVSPPPAIINAVEDSMRHLGVEVREPVPMKPGYIWSKLHS